MADHAKHGVAFAFEVGYADLTRVVSGVKAESLRQIHRSAQAVMRLGTTWILRGRTIEIGHARNGDKPCDFLDDFFPLFVDEPVNFGHEIRVGHCTHPLSFWACPCYFTRFSFRKLPAKTAFPDWHETAAAASSVCTPPQTARGPVLATERARDS